MESFIILFLKAQKVTFFTAAFLYSKRREMTYLLPTCPGIQVVMLLNGQLATLAICTEHYSYSGWVSDP